MKAVRTVFTRLPRLASVLLGVLLALLLGQLTFLQAHYSQFYAPASVLSNLALALIACGFLAAWLLCAPASRLPATGAGRPLCGEGRSIKRLCAVWAALFVLQCVMARSTWFYLGFDAGNVRAYSAALATGGWIDADYYRLCPNNAPLTALLSVPYWLGGKLGLAEPYVLEVYLSALMVNLSGLFTLLCVRKLTPSRAARGFAFALTTLWLLFSPYITMPYTDSFAVLFPVLAFYVTLSGLKAPVRYGLCALVCSFGAAIKPSAMIPLIAVLLLKGCDALARLPWTAAFIRRAAVTLLAMAIGFLPGRAFQTGSTALLAGSAKPEEMLDTAHYLMIGLDDQYWGGHSVEMLEYSQTFTTLRERNAANLRRAWQNLAGRSLGENLRFFSVKAYKAYADGTFAYNGSALMDAVPKRTDALSVFLRRIFYARGDLNPLYCTVAQGLWLLCLVLCAAGALLARKRPQARLASVTLLGLTAYQLLFEVWPRYLFLYVPVFIVLGCVGLCALGDVARARRQRMAAPLAERPFPLGKERDLE